jgi:heptosyltransferase II
VNRVLIFHTAFPGDIVLTLPVAQRLRALVPGVHIGMVTIPAASDLLRNHPAIDERIVYDKKGARRGLAGIVGLARLLARSRFDAAIIPHRSLRSAVVCRLAGIPVRIGFATSAGRFLLTHRVDDDRNVHEISRNLRLLAPLGIAPGGMELPRLYPDRTDREMVDALLLRHSHLNPGHLVAMAPGSVWNTKRWPRERFAELAGRLAGQGRSVILIGGAADRDLCAEIVAASGSSAVASAAGELPLLGSAELIRRCSVLVTNDSAPMHCAVAVGTRVVAIFGATVPAFGFAPAGQRDVVIDTPGLACRPCSIHGGNACPIGTFECMLRIEAGRVADAVFERRELPA